MSICYTNVVKRFLSILVIADETVVKLLKFLIKESNYKGSKVFSIQSIKYAKKRRFDLVITNLHEGILTLSALLELYEKTPILYIGQNKELAEQAINRGAQDFLMESELTPQLLTRIFHYSITREGIKNTLRERSFTDDLTGIYNRRGFFTLAQQYMGVAQRTHHGFLLFMFDLDFFKAINDTYGHASGDLALIDVANSLVTAFRSNDIIARIGGDEFAVIALNCHKSAEKMLKEHVFRLLKALNKVQNRPYFLSCSVGVTYYEGEEIEILDLLARADKALYRHKQKRHSLLLGREERI